MPAASREAFGSWSSEQAGQQKGQGNRHRAPGPEPDKRPEQPAGHQCLSVVFVRSN